MKHSRVALRLVWREYVPMAAGILTWLVAAAAIGHADAVRLLTAVIFTRSARAFTMTDTRFVIRQRLGADGRVYRKSLRRARRIEAASFAVSLALVGIVIGLLEQIGQRDTALMTAVAAAALPARHLATFGAHCHPGLYRVAVACTGLALIVLAWAAGLGLWSFVVAIAAREWIALAIVLLPPLQAGRDEKARIRDEPLTFLEVAASTALRSRSRFAYRIGRTLLGLIPLGGVLARAGRSMGMHRRLAPWTSRSVYPIILIAVGCLLGAIALPVALAKPGTLAISASLFRIAASAGNVLLWWRFADDQELDRDELDDDDDD